jgi:hypothetical protein
MTKKTSTATRNGIAGRRKNSSRKDAEIQKRITSLLDAFEEQITKKDFKISVSDYIRLLQFRREFEQQQPRAIEVKWVDTLKETNASEE